MARPQSGRRVRCNGCGKAVDLDEIHKMHKGAHKDERLCHTCFGKAEQEGQAPGLLGHIEKDVDAPGGAGSIDFVFAERNNKMITVRLSGDGTFIASSATENYSGEGQCAEFRAKRLDCGTFVFNPSQQAFVFTLEGSEASLKNDCNWATAEADYQDKDVMAQCPNGGQWTCPVQHDKKTNVYSLGGWYCEDGDNRGIDVFNSQYTPTIALAGGQSGIDKLRNLCSKFATAGGDDAGGGTAPTAGGGGGAAQKLCTTCNQAKGKASFAGAQWKKASGSRRVCKDCRETLGGEYILPHEDEFHGSTVVCGVCHGTGGKHQGKECRACHGLGRQDSCDSCDGVGHNHQSNDVCVDCTGHGGVPTKVEKRKAAAEPKGADRDQATGPKSGICPRCGNAMRPGEQDDQFGYCPKCVDEIWADFYASDRQNN